MPYLFKTKNKPTKLPEAETVIIEHNGVSVELQKIGSLTLSEKMMYEWFQVELAKDVYEVREDSQGKKETFLARKGIRLVDIPVTHWMIVSSLAYQEIRMQTLNPKYKPDFSLASKIAAGERVDQLGIKDQAGNVIEIELFNKIWSEFWDKERLGWKEREDAVAEASETSEQSGKTLTGTESIST